MGNAYVNPANRSAEPVLGSSGIAYSTQASRIAGGGACQKVAISGTSAQSAAITVDLVHLTPTVDCYVREAVSPTALSDGTDHFLVANSTQAFRVGKNNKLAFITTGATGSVHIAPVGV